MCCGNSANPTNAWNDDSRTCHDQDPTATVDMSYPAYTTCESACKRVDTPYTEDKYYDDCKNSSDGEQKAAMKDTAPDTNAKANKKTWCICVATCLKCTEGAGGIGERPTWPTALTWPINFYWNSKFDAIHGTCVPPPASWAVPTVTNADTDTSTPSISIVKDTNFICAATDPAGMPSILFVKFP